ncbi:hypothetical protein D8760_19790, partial [Proteus mirabilis]|nr:hypothetical protein [Proteus mirabilis]
KNLERMNIAHVIDPISEAYGTRFMMSHIKTKPVFCYNISISICQVLIIQIMKRDAVIIIEF